MKNMGVLMVCMTVYGAALSEPPVILKLPPPGRVLH
jgi:hypothetical protein